MKLSLSVRIGEAPGSKVETIRSFDEIAESTGRIGYHAVCMRASQAGIQTPLQEITAIRQKAREHNLTVSMVTGDFPVPINNDQAPDGLRNITPYLDLTDLLDADLIRIAMKKEEDIAWVQRASDEAHERNIRLAHQSHTRSLFETVAGSVEVLERVNRPNFGIIYEPSNLNVGDEDYGIETLKQFAPYLFNVYLQNYVGHFGTGEWIRLQDPGGIDFPLVFQGLAEVGYDGHVTVHQAFSKFTGPTAPEDSAQESYDYLTQIADFEPR